MIGIVSFAFWSLILSFLFFYALKYNERLRIDPLYEIIGMDFQRHFRLAKTSKKFLDGHLFNERNLIQK
jgi:ammonia channel protein AmtB